MLQFGGTDERVFIKREQIMNIAIIFAGGVGRRMKYSKIPKQFLKLNGKEIIIHTIEHFQSGLCCRLA